MKRVLAAVAATLGVLIVLGLSLRYTEAYYVAATEPHTALRSTGS